MDTPGLFVSMKSVGMYHKYFLWASEKSQNIETVAEKNTRWTKWKGLVFWWQVKKTQTKPEKKQAHI